MAEYQPHSVVFLDLDHTLLEGPFDSVVFPRVLGEISQSSGLGFEILLRQVRQESARRQADSSFSAVQAMDWDDIFTQTASQYGLQLQANALELVREHCQPPHAVLHPGAREALDLLAASKPFRALVLATKGLRRYQLPILEAHDLLKYFDDILTPDATQTFKQSLAFYRHWPKVTRVQIMVGDTYEDDILPARSFGFKTVCRTGLVPSSLTSGSSIEAVGPENSTAYHTTILPDAVIYSLSELPRVVDRLEHAALRA
jgi:FMN phosphatase YigB (HAD superfamily)